MHNIQKKEILFDALLIVNRVFLLQQLHCFDFNLEWLQNNLWVQGHWHAMYTLNIHKHAKYAPSIPTNPKSSVFSTTKGSWGILSLQNVWRIMHNNGIEKLRPYVH